MHRARTHGWRQSRSQSPTMKYLFLALSFASIAACQDSGTDTDTGLKTGYIAGYQLTCGFSWKPGNGIVVEKEFARDFLDGAIMCARKHPKRARRVLGLPIAEKTTVAREPGRQTEVSSEATEAKPVLGATGTPQKSAAHTAHTKKPSRTPAKKVKKPASRPRPQKRTAKAPSKAKVSSGTRKAPKKPTERKAMAPVKTKKAPVAATAAPPKAKAPVKTATPTPTTVTSAPKAKATPPAAASTTRRQEHRRKPISDYQRFMGQ
jgi:hypothetical protein